MAEFRKWSLLHRERWETRACIIPLLFRYYINSFINEISRTGIGCCLGDFRSNIVPYVYESLLLTETVGYNKLVKYIDEHLFTINPVQTKCVISDRLDEPAHNIDLNGDVIQVVRILDIIFLLTWETPMTSVLGSKFYASFNGVFRSFKSVAIDTFIRF